MLLVKILKMDTKNKNKTLIVIIEDKFVPYHPLGVTILIVRSKFYRMPIFNTLPVTYTIIIFIRIRSIVLLVVCYSNLRCMLPLRVPTSSMIVVVYNIR